MRVRRLFPASSGAPHPVEHRWESVCCDMHQGHQTLFGGSRVLDPNSRRSGIHRYHHQPNITFRMGLFLIDNSVVADRRTRLALLRLLIIYVYVMFFVRFLAFSSSYWNPTAFNHLVVFVSSIQAYYISGLIAYIPHIYFLLQTSAHRILEDCFHSVLHTCIEALTNYSSLSNI